MHDSAGSAAAPVARPRNARRASFIVFLLNTRELGDDYVMARSVASSNHCSENIPRRLSEREPADSVAMTERKRSRCYAGCGTGAGLVSEPSRRSIEYDAIG